MKKKKGSFCLLGKMKALKPFKFTHYGKWTDGFVQHGIFEIIAKRGHLERPKDPTCIVQRIASCHPDLKIGEQRSFPESYLREYTTPVSMECFTQKERL